VRREVEALLAQEETAAGQTIWAGLGAGALTQFGPYKIDAKLGEGGMGEVFRATDTRLHRTVAIKMLRGQGSTDPSARERFQREARAAMVSKETTTHYPSSALPRTGDHHASASPIPRTISGGLPFRSDAGTIFGSAIHFSTCPSLH
jgi:serine/threonine protein kinase